MNFPQIHFISGAVIFALVTALWLLSKGTATLRPCYFHGAVMSAVSASAA
jgi:hypothetical protein